MLNHATHAEHRASCRRWISFLYRLILTYTHWIACRIFESFWRLTSLVFAWSFIFTIHLLCNFSSLHTHALTDAAAVDTGRNHVSGRVGSENVAVSDLGRSSSSDRSATRIGVFQHDYAWSTTYPAGMSRRGTRRCIFNRCHGPRTMFLGLRFCCIVNYVELNSRNNDEPSSLYRLGYLPSNNSNLARLDFSMYGHGHRIYDFIELSSIDIDREMK